MTADSDSCIDHLNVVELAPVSRNYFHDWFDQPLSGVLVLSDQIHLAYRAIASCYNTDGQNWQIAKTSPFTDHALIAASQADAASDGRTTREIISSDGYESISARIGDSEPSDLFIAYCSGDRIIRAWRADRPMMMTAEQGRLLLLGMLGTLMCDGATPMVEVAVVDEDGAVQGELIAFPGECLQYAYEHSLPCLRCVDPYGDTVFNRMQVKVVLEEITLLERECGEKHRDVLARVRAMCLSFGDLPHRYLKFIGD